MPMSACPRWVSKIGGKCYFISLGFCILFGIGHPAKNAQNSGKEDCPDQEGPSRSYTQLLFSQGMDKAVDSSETITMPRQDKG